jgi:hypothetical protein
VIISTMNDLPGYEIDEICGEVFGLTVRARLDLDGDLRLRDGREGEPARGRLTGAQRGSHGRGRGNQPGTARR